MADILGNLSAMSHQDEMELGSEAGNIDEDFDIDFEPTGEAHRQENEYAMQDDTAGPEDQDIELRSATDVNDYMEDDVDVAAHVAASPDGLMVDVPPLAPVDEDLLDLSEDEEETKATVVADTFDPDDVRPAAKVEPLDSANAKDLQTEHVAGNDEAGDASLEKDFEHPGEEDNYRQDDRIASEELHEHQHSQLFSGKNDLHPLDHSGVAAQVDQVDEHTHLARSESLQGDAPHRDSAEDPNPHVTSNSSDPSGAIETTAQVLSPDHSQVEEKSTVTGLHPTIVIYDGGRYSLFPSSEPAGGEEYFLEDENLVSGSIGDLLHACRVVLAETISEDDELELGIERLGLFIGEDSTTAFSTSFSELLDLFVHLHMNEGILAPPLGVSLTKRPRFANRYTLLANAVAEGKGMSQVAFKADLQTYDESQIRGPEDEDETQYQDAVESYRRSGANDEHERGQGLEEQDEPYELDISNDSEAGEDRGDDEKSANDNQHTTDDHTNSSSNNASYEGSTHEHADDDEQEGASLVEEEFDVNSRFAEEFAGDNNSTFEDDEDHAGQAVGDGHRASIDAAGAAPVDIGNGPTGSLGAAVDEPEEQDHFDEFLVTEDSVNDDEQAQPSPNGDRKEAEATETETVEKDEIDFEDDLEEADGASANDKDDISITLETPRGKGKRGLDDTDTNLATDPEAKRPRPL